MVSVPSNDLCASLFIVHDSLSFNKFIAAFGGFYLMFSDRGALRVSHFVFEK